MSKFTHVVPSRCAYALKPPRDLIEAEPTPRAGFLKAGTKVKVLETLEGVNDFSGNGSSFYLVRTEGGIEAYIQTDSVRPLG